MHPWLNPSEWDLAQTCNSKSKMTAVTSKQVVFCESARLLGVMSGLNSLSLRGDIAKSVEWHRGVRGWLLVIKFTSSGHTRMSKNPERLLRLQRLHTSCLIAIWTCCIIHKPKIQSHGIPGQWIPIDYKCTGSVCTSTPSSPPFTAG